MKPKLNSTKWLALSKINQSDLRVFTSIECNVHGSALHSLEKCGWIERTTEQVDLPWQVNTQGNKWRLTDQGKSVLEILPTIKPRN